MKPMKMARVAGLMALWLGVSLVMACAQPESPKPVAPPVAVTGVTLDAAKSLAVGAKATLLPVVAPANAANKAVTWTSASPTVASVGTDGTVYAHSAGSAVVSVKTTEGAFTASTTVTVSTSGDLLFSDTFASGSLANWNLLKGTAEVSTDNGKPVLKFTSDKTQGIGLQLVDTLWTALGSPTSFYVEADVRPLSDSVSDKNIGFASNISADRTAFYYSGLNFNNRFQSGVYPGVVKGYQNTSGVPILKPDGAYRTDGYKVRYEVTVSAASPAVHAVMLYVNDIAIGKPVAGSATVTAVPVNPVKYTIPAANQVANGTGLGILTSGSDFVLGNVRVGKLATAVIDSTTTFSAFNRLTVGTSDAAFAPYLQTSLIPYLATLKTLRVGDAAISFTPTATKADGSADNVVITTSSNALTLSAASVASGTAFTVTPASVGAAKLTIASESDPTNFRTIDFTVNQQLTYQATDYGTLTSQLSPADKATTVYTDDVLELTFDAAPTVASDGVAYLYNATTDVLVDTIGFSLEKNTYGSRTLNVGSQLSRVEGNKVVLTPHAGKLVAGVTYSVVIPNNVIKGTLNTKAFTGFVATDKKWTFTVQAANAPTVDAITVAKAGSASFRTIQAALNYAASAAGTADVTISLAAGTYRENLSWNTAKNLTIKAATGVANTAAVVAFENYDALNTGTDNRPLVLIGASAKAVTLDGITLQNTRTKAENPSASNQAETIYFNNTTGSLTAKNSRFDSRQDTILVKGTSWFYNCYVTGDVDFIWGYPVVALFEKSTIHSRLDDRGATNPAYVLQSRAMKDAKGFVFLECDFTIDAARTVDSFLARTGGAGTATSADSWDSVAIIKSRLSPKFAAVGWSDDGGKTVYPKPATAAVGWREYGNVVEGTTTAVDTSKRFSGSYVMTDAEYTAGYADRGLILAGTALSAAAP